MRTSISNSTLIKCRVFTKTAAKAIAAQLQIRLLRNSIAGVNDVLWVAVLLTFIIHEGCNNRRAVTEKSDYVSEPLEKVEEFNIFFDSFKSDSLLQRQRIDENISIIIADEDNVKETYQMIDFVSFRREDWNGDIIVEVRPRSPDTTMVVLEVIDTGIHIEHMFALRSGLWYLFQIRNLSD